MSHDSYYKNYISDLLRYKVCRLLCSFELICHVINNKNGNIVNLKLVSKHFVKNQNIY